MKAEDIRELGAKVQDLRMALEKAATVAEAREKTEKEVCRTRPYGRVWIELFQAKLAWEDLRREVLKAEDVVAQAQEVLRQLCDRLHGFGIEVQERGERLQDQMDDVENAAAPALGQEQWHELKCELVHELQAEQERQRAGRPN